MTGWVALKAALLEAGSLLGVLQGDPDAWFEQSSSDVEEGDTIQRLIEARQVARSTGDFEAADRIRGELAALGIAVEDRADGPIWRRTS